MSIVIKGGVDKAVDNASTTGAQPVKKSATSAIMHVVISALGAAGIAFLHSVMTGFEGCEVLTADPETAGLLGATIRGVLLAVRTGV